MAFFQDSWRTGGTGYGGYTFRSRSISEVPFTIQMLAGQVANAFEIKNSLGTTIFSVDPTGNVTYTGSETITDALTVTGATHLLGTLEVDGVSTFDGSILANSVLYINNLLDFNSSATINPSRYQIAQNSSNHLQYNVPLVYQHQFTVEGAVRMAISSTVFSVNTPSVFGGGMTINGSLNLSGIAYFSIAPVITVNGIDSTTAAGLTIQNTTAAIAGTAQWSPAVVLAGRGWNTGSGTSTTEEFAIFNIVSQGTTANNTLAFYYRHGGTGSWTSSGMLLGQSTLTVPSITMSAGQVVKQTSVTSASYAPTSSDYIINVNYSGICTINLPAAASHSGRVYHVHDVSGALNGSTKIINVDGNASETINGLAVWPLTAPYNSVSIYSNGTAWFVF